MDRRSVNESVWRLLDLELVCQAGGELYTVDSFRNFFQRLLGLKFEEPPQVSLWRINRGYIIYLRYRNYVYHINLRNKEIYKGESGPDATLHKLNCDEDRMELNLMCLFVLSTVDRVDERGRRWSK